MSATGQQAAAAESTPLHRTTLAELRNGRPGRTVRFDGADLGSATSFFLVDAEPGTGPDLHRHGYPETWIVLAGTARFKAGDAWHEAAAGDVLVVPAGVPHRFIADGTQPLSMVCIHASDRIIQTFI